MRKLQDLVTNQERVWLWFATDEARERFVRQCAEEGFAFRDGTIPTMESMYPDFQKWERFLDYELKDFEREYAL